MAITSDVERSAVEMPVKKNNTAVVERSGDNKKFETCIDT